MSSRRQVLVLAASDTLALTTCAVLAWWLKSLDDPRLAVGQYLRTLPILVLAGLASFAGAGLYPSLGWGAAEELRRLSHTTSLVFLAGVALTFLSKAGEGWSRQVFTVAWLLALVAVPLARAAVRHACCGKSWWGIPCLILGAGRTGAQVVALLQSRPWLGLRPVAVVDDDVARHGSRLGEFTVIGPMLPRAAELAATGVRHGVLAIPGLPADRLGRLLDGLGDHLRHLYIAPAMPGSPDVIAEAREFANTLVLEVRQNLLRTGARVVKRTMDLGLALLIALLFSWLLAAIALAVRLTSRGPVFYGQVRIGRGGTEFRAWKFRSMVADADAILDRYLDAHPELRDQWERDHKLKDDPRITWIGRVLRRTSLDELPQLWNVLRGEMSLVGPRPIVSDEIGKYGDRFALYQKVRPGMSGLWQVSGRNDTTYAERVALDCYYVRNWSVWIDLVVLARTVRVVLLGKGAY